MGKLEDRTNHSDWLVPHSMEWYKQLGEQEGTYHYPWDSVIAKPNGESVFLNNIL